MSTEACYKVLGRNVQRARKGAALTQADLAEHIGMTRTNVANLEAGRVRTPVHRLLRVADVTGATLESLLRGVASAPLPTGDEIAGAVMALKGRRRSDFP